MSKITQRAEQDWESDSEYFLNPKMANHYKNQTKQSKRKLKTQSVNIKLMNPAHLKTTTVDQSVVQVCFPKSANIRSTRIDMYARTHTRTHA